MAKDWIQRFYKLKEKYENSGTISKETFEFLSNELIFLAHGLVEKYISCQKEYEAEKLCEEKLEKVSGGAGHRTARICAATLAAVGAATGAAGIEAAVDRGNSHAIKFDEFDRERKTGRTNEQIRIDDEIAEERMHAQYVQNAPCCQHGLCFELDDATDTAVVTTVCDRSSTEEITVPSTIVHQGKTYRVIRIADRAFRKSHARQVHVKEGILKLGMDVFLDATTERCFIPKSVEEFYSGVDYFIY